MDIDFIQIPTIVVQSDKITDGDKLIYGIIYYLSQLSDKECWASNKTIAEIRGCSPSTISHAVKRLDDAQFINIWNKTSKKRRIKPLIILKQVNLSHEIAEPSSNKIEQPISNEIQSNNILSNNINNIITKFSFLGDSYKRFYKIKSYRDAVERLLTRFSLQEIIEKLDYVFSHKDDKFAIQINTPFDLENKWDKIKIIKDKSVDIDSLFNKYNK